MKRYELSLTDAEDIRTHYQDHSGLETEFMPLSADGALCHFEMVELGHTTLIWTTLKGKARWVDRLKEGHTHFAYLVSHDNPATISGEQAVRGDVNVWMPGLESDCIVDGFMTSLEISIDDEMTRALGWKPRGKNLRSVALPLLDELTACCLAATHAARIEKHMGAEADPSGDWEAEILEKTEGVLQPWLSDSSEEAPEGTPYFQLVQKSEAYLAKLDNQSDLSMDELAEALGVPRRTLFHAYREQLGIGPRRHLELVRLHRLRSRLKRLSDEQTTVTEQAYELGFSHPSRLAALYREHFGETPVETLRRGAA